MPAPWPCVACGVKPRRRAHSEHCFDCILGGPKTPPPCKRCGSTDDYYASGLCVRCHHFAPQVGVDSCLDCYAWGATRHTKWRCWPCLHWHDEYDIRHCTVCRRNAPVNAKRMCRLCTRQYSLIRRTNRVVTPHEANRHGQQLWLANMFKKARVARPHPAGDAPRTIPAIIPVRHRQLVLFDMAPDLSGGRTVVPEPRCPDLVASLEHVAREIGATRGWTYVYASNVRAGIRVVVGLQPTPGAAVTASEVEVIRQLRLPVRSVREVFETAGMFEEDREANIVQFFHRHTDGIPPAIAEELGEWFDIMRNGSTTSPRRLPRSETTIRIYLAAAMPAIGHWIDAGLESLREVSRDHVLDALRLDNPAMVLRSIRSIFTILKARKRVFVDPTARMPAITNNGHPPVPVDVEVIRDALNSPDPARAALTALIAFHGLGVAQLQQLRCTDIRDGRIHLEDRAIVLAAPVQQRVRTWIDHRTRQWPDTTNPYLFIHFRTAKRTEPVGNRWIKLTLNIPGNVRALRQDRILHEAHATGGDTRRLCDLFGLSIQAATRYTNTVDHPDLLEL